MSAPSPLDGLCGPAGPLSKEPPDADEFKALLGSGKVRLHDAARRDLSIESGFDLAYNAPGHYPSPRSGTPAFGMHYIVFQELEHTLGLGPEVWRVLAHAHDARNRTEYARARPPDDHMIESILAACERVMDAVIKLPAIPANS